MLVNYGVNLRMCQAHKPEASISPQQATSIPKQFQEKRAQRMRANH